jgi:hypothetical protein
VCCLTLHPDLSVQLGDMAVSVHSDCRERRTLGVTQSPLLQVWAVSLLTPQLLATTEFFHFRIFSLLKMPLEMTLFLSVMRRLLWPDFSFVFLAE